MKSSRAYQDRKGWADGAVRRSKWGFTLLELCVAMGIVVVMTAICGAGGEVVAECVQGEHGGGVGDERSADDAVPGDLDRVSVSGHFHQRRLRSIRFRAIRRTRGRLPMWATRSCLRAVPNMMNQNTTITFRPGGAVTSPQALANGNTPMTLTYSNATPEVITVSAYGRINVTP